MNFYLVIHDIKSFEEHPDWIGREGMRFLQEFSRLTPSDGIIYYCTGDCVITGTFRVRSAARVVDNDPKWMGQHVVVDIEPFAQAKWPYVPFQEMLDSLPEPFSIFPERKLAGIKLKGKRLLSISERDFELASTFVKEYRPPEKPLFQGPVKDCKCGENGDYGVMKFAPTNEQGVVALFVHYMNRLGFDHLKFIRAGFPDACAITKSGSEKYIEFEFLSSGFHQHIDNPEHRKVRCDYVVCWEDNFKTCQVERIELKSRLGFEKNRQSTMEA